MTTALLSFGSQSGMQCHLPLGVYDGDCPAGHAGGESMQVTTAPQGMPMTPPSPALASALAPPDASAVARAEASGASPSTAPPSARGPAPSMKRAVAASSEPPPSVERGALDPLAW